MELDRVLLPSSFVEPYDRRKTRVPQFSRKVQHVSSKFDYYETLVEADLIGQIIFFKMAILELATEFRGTRFYI